MIYQVPSMKTIAIGIFACVSLDTYGQKQPEKLGTGIIFSRGERVTNENFKETAYLKMLIAADSINPTAVGNVAFEPEARTKRHSHPGGQILLMIDGVEYYQEKGQPKKLLRKGEILKCPRMFPIGMKPVQAFVQVAVTNNHLGPRMSLIPLTTRARAVRL